MKITAGQAKQDRDIAAETDFLEVPWAITEDIEGVDGNPATVETLLEGVQAFPLTVTADEVKEFLSAKMRTYKENVALHAGAKELQAAIDNGQKVAGEITGVEISE